MELELELELVELELTQPWLSDGKPIAHVTSNVDTVYTAIAAFVAYG